LGPVGAGAVLGALWEVEPLLELLDPDAAFATAAPPPTRAPVRARVVSVALSLIDLLSRQGGCSPNV
jgi:hypothetical protein